MVPFNKITKTILLGSLTDFHKYLQTGEINNPFTFYSSKIRINHEIMKHNTEDPCHSIRVYKTDVLFNSWYVNDFRSSEFVAALDYKILPNDIRIEFMNINDDECSYVNKPITQDESKVLNTEILEYVKNCAIKEKKEKVIIDVHSNLRLYNKYYKDAGFKITGRKCGDNPFWEEVEIKV